MRVMNLAELRHQLGDERRRARQRLGGRHLRADVHVKGDQVERRAVPHRREQRAHIVDRYPELVDLEAGGNVRMALRVDVRVDAQRHARHKSQPRRDRFDACQLPHRFDVDRLETERYGAFELGGRFADAREDDVSGGKSGFAGQLDFPNRVGVGGAAELAQRPRETERGVGLECVMEPVRIAAEGAVDRTIALAQHGGAVDVDRCPFRFSDRRQQNAVAHKLLGSTGETDHEDV